MTATTEGRNTPRRTGNKLSVVVEDTETLYAGTLVTLLAASGLAVPGGTASAGPVVGVASETITGDGVITTDLERGIFRFANSASADEIEKANIGADCYVVDNQTVALTDDTGARERAGKIIDVDAAGVWVEVG